MTKELIDNILRDLGALEVKVEHSRDKMEDGFIDGTLGMISMLKVSLRRMKSDEPGQGTDIIKKMLPSLEGKISLFSSKVSDQKDKDLATKVEKELKDFGTELGI